MKYDELFPSKFLKASDFEEGETKLVTIKDVQLEEVGKKDAEVETKPVVYFREKDTKPIVCNKTNATTIRNLYGNDTYDWIGKRITLFVTQVDSFGEQVDAIRVRAKIPAATANPAPEQIPGNGAHAEEPKAQQPPALPPTPDIPSHDHSPATEQLQTLVAKWQTMITRPQTEEQIKKARQITAVRLGAVCKDSQGD
jgi:hypothetical protein